MILDIGAHLTCNEIISHASSNTLCNGCNHSMVAEGPNPKHCELIKESVRDAFSKKYHTVVENKEASAAILKRLHGQVPREIPRFKNQNYLQCGCVSIRFICPCPVRIELMFMFACHQHRTIRTKTLFENNN